MKGVSSVSANTVVAATDLSEASAKAVEQAALLAKQWNAELTLLHVFNEEGWKALMALFEGKRSINRVIPSADELV